MTVAHEAQMTWAPRTKHGVSLDSVRRASQRDGSSKGKVVLHIPAGKEDALQPAASSPELPQTEGPANVLALASLEALLLTQVSILPLSWSQRPRRD